MKILDYKPVNKNSILGNFNLLIPEWDNVTIFGMTLFQKEGRRWITFPARAYEVDNQKKYVSHLRFPTMEDMNRFQEKVIKAIEEYAREKRAQAAEGIQNVNQPFNKVDPKPAEVFDAF